MILMKLFNTLSRKRETFTPLKGEVGMYTCGPTVYHYAHIGNLRSFIFEDVLKRALLFNKYKVKHVMNITDVGHLSSDADEGEDKMLKGAKREKKTVWEVANFYTKAFQDDLKKLNVLPPDIWAKATDHIKEQVALVEKLEEKGFIYIAGGNVYFDTSKIKNYGKLARLKIDAKTKSRATKDKNKKNPTDFVLWFTKSKFLDQEMQWDSPWGKGYPGWHIECSAMASKYLGEQFDIHCGGRDLIPVHHTNEIAQAEAAFGKKPWVKYWAHNEFLVDNQGKKMAKSAGEFLTLNVLEEKGFAPLDYRYFCLGTYYGNPLMFSLEALESAKNARKKLVEKVLGLDNSGKENKKLQEKYLKQFTADINDDLNTSKTLATVWGVLKDENLSDKDAKVLLLKFDEVLGLGLRDLKAEKISTEVKKLAEERLKARNKKNWVQSDKLRDKISELGYVIEDTKEGYGLKKK